MVEDFHSDISCHLETISHNNTTDALSKCLQKHKEKGLQKHIGGTFMRVEINQLEGDTDKIRMVNKEFVQQLLKSFTNKQHFDDLTPMICSTIEQDKKYMVIDRNHRLSALKLYKGLMSLTDPDFKIYVGIKAFSNSTPVQSLRALCAGIHLTNDTASAYSYVDYVASYVTFSKESIPMRVLDECGYLAKSLKPPRYKSNLPAPKLKRKTEYVAIATFILKNDPGLVVWRNLQHLIRGCPIRHLLDVVQQKNWPSKQKAITCLVAVGILGLPNAAARNDLTRRIVKADDSQFYKQVREFMKDRVYNTKVFMPRKRSAPTPSSFSDDTPSSASPPITDA